MKWWHWVLLGTGAYVLLRGAESRAAEASTGWTLHHLKDGTEIFVRDSDGAWYTQGWGASGSKENPNPPSIPHGELFP